MLVLTVNICINCLITYAFNSNWKEFSVIHKVTNGGAYLLFVDFGEWVSVFKNIKKEKEEERNKESMKINKWMITMKEKNLCMKRKKRN